MKSAKDKVMKVGSKFYYDSEPKEVTDTYHGTAISNGGITGQKDLNPVMSYNVTECSN